jgi:hypothetical protein
LKAFNREFAGEEGGLPPLWATRLKATQRKMRNEKYKAGAGPLPNLQIYLR